MFLDVVVVLVVVALYFTCPAAVASCFDPCSCQLFFFLLLFFLLLLVLSFALCCCCGISGVDKTMQGFVLNAQPFPRLHARGGPCPQVDEAIEHINGPLAIYTTIKIDGALPGMCKQVKGRTKSE